MIGWLSCNITPGQFTNEYAVQGTLFDGSDFSLFAEESDLRFDQKPTEEGSPVRGMIRVFMGDQKEDMVLVMLPRPTLENGRSVTVKQSEVQWDN